MVNIATCKHRNRVKLKKMRVQQDHWTLLLDFCETHPEIITNKFAGPNGKNQQQKLWQQLTCMLNSLGYGEKKELEWKKTLTDWKSKTKAKAGALRLDQKKTGGGEGAHIMLTNNEERLLKLMGKTAVEGNEGVPELGIKKNDTNNSADIPPLQALKTGLSFSQKVSATNNFNASNRKILNVNILQPSANCIPNPCIPSSSKQVFSTKNISAENSAHCNSTDLNIHTPKILVELRRPCNDGEPPLKKVCVPLSKMVPLKEQSTENKSSGTGTYPKNKKITTASKKKLNDLFTDMNSEVLTVLQSIDNNMSSISTSLIKIVNLLEKDKV